MNIGSAIDGSQIVTVGSNTLKFAIPPDQLKYARPMAESKPAIKDTPKHERALQPDNVTQSAAPNNLNGQAPNVANEHYSDPTSGMKPPSECKPDDAGATKDHVTEMKIYATGGEINGQEIGAIVVKSVEQHENRDPCANLPVVDVENGEEELVSKTEIKQTTAEFELIDHNSSTTAAASALNSDGAILHEISTLGQLEVKILEIDGRLNLNEVRPSINPWKALRGKRNNQDLGTLFEMREEFYVWKHPHIPKPPRSGAYGLR